MSTRIMAIILILIINSTTSLQAQLLLHPSALFINQATRTGSMHVVNNSAEMMEIFLTFRFGYITYDSSGNNFFNYNDTINEKDYSLIPYIKVFPPKLLIPPGKTASIRFIVRGIPDTADHYYWTRIIASATSESGQIDTTIDEGKVTTKMAVKSEFNGLIAYKAGKVTSELDFKLYEYYTDSSGVNLLIDQIKGGNSPYWGTLYTEIFDSANRLVEERREPLHIYFSCTRKMIFDKSKFSPGNYKARITATTERAEILPEFRPYSMPKTKTFEFFIR